MQAQISSHAAALLQLASTASTLPMDVKQYSKLGLDAPHHLKTDGGISETGEYLPGQPNTGVSAVGLGARRPGGVGRGGVAGARLASVARGRGFGGWQRTHAWRVFCFRRA